MANGVGFKSPDQIREELAQRRAQMVMEISNQGRSPAERAGLALGAGLAQFISNQFTDDEDNEKVQQAEQRQEIMEGLDPSAPKEWFSAAKTALNKGDAQFSDYLINKGMQLTSLSQAQQRIDLNKANLQVQMMEQEREKVSLKGDLFDEQGFVKNEVAADIFGRALETVGGKAVYNPQTGLIEKSEATPKQRSLARNLATVAEAKLRSREASSPNSAMKLAVDELGQEITTLAKQDKEEKVGKKHIPLTNKTRGQLQESLVKLQSLLPRIREAEELAPFGTGIWNNFQRLLSNLGELTFGVQTFEEEQEARRVFQQFRQQFVETMKKHGSRLKIEAETFIERLPKSNDFLKAPNVALQDLAKIEKDLINRMSETADALDLEFTAPLPSPAAIGQMSLEDIKNTFTPDKLQLLDKEHRKALRNRINTLQKR